MSNVSDWIGKSCRAGCPTYEDLTPFCTNVGRAPSPADNPLQSVFEIKI
jgi:hypothetical protein